LISASPTTLNLSDAELSNAISTCFFNQAILLVLIYTLPPMFVAKVKINGNTHSDSIILIVLHKSHSNKQNRNRFSLSSI
jgi:hypothetical protein